MSSWLFRFPLFLASNERDAVMVRFSSSARSKEPLDDEELEDGVGDGRREWYWENGVESVVAMDTAGERRVAMIDRNSQYELLL